MGISKEQIEFIDKFLQRNDVIFIDIRQEMTDHIASAVEEKMKLENTNFHETFVGYVNFNKKELFKMNRNIWWFSIPEIKNYLSFLINPTCLFVNVLLVILYSLFHNHEKFKSLKVELPFYFIISFFVLGLINFVYFSIIKRKKYFFIERNGIVITILYWIDLFLLKPIKGDDNFPSGLLLVFMILCVVYVFYTINQVKKFIKLGLN